VINVLWLATAQFTFPGSMIRETWNVIQEDYPGKSRICTARVTGVAVKREQFRRFASAAHQPRAHLAGSRLMCCTRETTKLFPLHSHLLHLPPAVLTGT